MAHNLSQTRGRTSMMYTGEAPWHRLGTKLKRPATAKEAITAAGLDYTVSKTAIYAGPEHQRVPTHRAVVRDDTQDILGVVGKGYQLIQNHECFQFLDNVVEGGDIRYHTAGALGAGERIWMLAKLPGDIQIEGSSDVTEQYLLLSNSHNGGSALRVFFTPIRVVCDNTLTVATRQGVKQGVYIRHSGDLNEKVEEARKVLGLASKFYDEFGEQANHLARHQPSQQQLDDYFRAIYPDPLTGENTRARNSRRQLWQLFEEGRGQQDKKIRYTSWAALNAVTEYVDHHRTTRGRTEEAKDHSRLNSIWFGSGADLKRKAWTLALQMTAG